MKHSSVGLNFLVFAIICLSMILQMQSATAISCNPGETNTTAIMSRHTCEDCRKDLQTNCGLQGRVVSHLECNYWDQKHIGEKVCEGCCQVPLPCPVQPPVSSLKCAPTDIDKTFKIKDSNMDCHRCKDGCKTRCDAIGADVGDQICGFLNTVKPQGSGLYCTCCCRKRVPYPPPPPPTPSPPPPPPSPPPPAPENICKPEDMYLTFSLSMTTGLCRTESSPRICKCCCEAPPPPTPPSPSLPVLSCDYRQAQAIARHSCKGQDTSFCESKCKSLSTALVLGGFGCEENAADPTDSYCICCYELDMCGSGSSLSLFSSKLLFKGLGQ